MPRPAELAADRGHPTQAITLHAFPEIRMKHGDLSKNREIYLQPSRLPQTSMTWQTNIGPVGGVRPPSAEPEAQSSASQFTAWASDGPEWSQFGLP